jgi:hypothetical protein
LLLIEQATIRFSWSGNEVPRKVAIKDYCVISAIVGKIYGLSSLKFQFLISIFVFVLTDIALELYSAARSDVEKSIRKFFFYSSGRVEKKIREA